MSLGGGSAAPPVGRTGRTRRWTQGSEVSVQPTAGSNEGPKHLHHKRGGQAEGGQSGGGGESLEVINRKVSWNGAQEEQHQHP